MGAEGGSQQSSLSSSEIQEHSKGFTPDMKALPTRSTGRYELDAGRERDAGALAKMLPDSPTEEQRAEVAFQAWTDAAIRAPIIHTHHLLQQLDEDSQTDLPEAKDAPTK